MDRRVIQELIAPYINTGYFRQPKRYLRRHFPGSAVSLAFVEQDGLIRRIQEVSQTPVAYPCVARAYHAGFYGYNRAGDVLGSLTEKIKTIGSIIYDVDAMRAAASHAGIAADSIPVTLSCGEWNVQRQVEI